jgi:hypothetical protein
MTKDNQATMIMIIKKVRHKQKQRNQGEKSNTKSQNPQNDQQIQY